MPNPAFSGPNDIDRPRSPVGQLVDKIKAQPPARLAIAAGAFALLLIMIIAMASGGDDGVAKAGGSDSGDEPSGSKLGELLDKVQSGDDDTPGGGDVIEAWKMAGLSPGGFAAIDSGDLDGSCRAGAVSGINVILCDYDSEEAAHASREAGLEKVGDATGASIAAGSSLLIVSDPQNIDPSGKRINKIIQAFRAVQ